MYSKSPIVLIFALLLIRLSVFAKFETARFAQNFSRVIRTRHLHRVPCTLSKGRFLTGSIPASSRRTRAFVTRKEITSSRFSQSCDLNFCAVAEYRVSSGPPLSRACANTRKPQPGLNYLPYYPTSSSEDLLVLRSPFPFCFLVSSLLIPRVHNVSFS